MKRFWDKVKKIEGECWEWMGCLDWNGNGQFWSKNRMVGAHRFAWELMNGPIPHKTKILRRCKNQRCVNPAHLFLDNETDENRFWKKVDKNGHSGCWEWTGGLNSHGYGEFWTKDQGAVAAHRFAWKLKYGPVPSGLWVLHRCDKSRCVNPEHLFLGRNKENQIDSVQKGRRPEVKLTMKSAMQIRKQYKTQNITQAQLALEHGISRSHVSRIVTNKKWKEEDFVGDISKY